MVPTLEVSCSIRFRYNPKDETSPFLEIGCVNTEPLEVFRSQFDAARKVDVADAARWSFTMYQQLAKAKGETSTYEGFLGFLRTLLMSLLIKQSDKKAASIGQIVMKKILTGKGAWTIFKNTSVEIFELLVRSLLYIMTSKYMYATSKYVS